MIKHYYADNKKNVQYVIDLCVCSSYLKLKKYWLDDEDASSSLWVGIYTDVKTCIEKARIDFSKSFNEKEYQMTIECYCWKKIPISMRNIYKKELDYAE